MKRNDKKYSSDYKRAGKKRPPKQFNKNGIPVEGQREPRTRVFPGE